MQLISTIISVLLAFKCAYAALYVEADIPSVFVNEEHVPVKLTVAGGDLGSGKISGVRTALFVPTKRGPKAQGNLTHTVFQTRGAELRLAPVYALAVKEYLVTYGVEIAYENGEKEWVESELQTIVAKDADVKFYTVIASVVVLSAILLAIFFLITRLSVPGYWERVLPASLHGLLPEKPKRA